MNRCARLSLQAAVERVLEELELGVASDERRARAERRGRAVEHVHEPPGTQRPVDALELERAGILDDEACGREAVRGRADEDLAGTGGLWSRAARLTASPVANVDSAPSTTTSPASIPIRASQLELVDRVAHGERCSRGALRVVLVRLRNAERGHDGVAGELLDDAAVLDDALRDRLEELRDAATHDLRIGSGRRAASSRRCRRTAPLRACAPRVKCRNDGGGASHPAVSARALASRPCSIRPCSRHTTSAGSIRRELDEDGAYRVARAYAAALRAARGRPRTRHAPLVARDARGRFRRNRGRRRGRRRARARRDRDALPRRHRARPRRRHLRHRVAQPEGVHGDEDRPTRRATRRRRLGACRDPSARREPTSTPAGPRRRARPRTSGRATSRRCSPSSTSTPSARCASSSTRRTAWQA